MNALIEPAPVPKNVRVFRFAYAVLTLQFALPAASYLVTPSVAMQQLDTLNQLLGGGPLGSLESTGHLWHMLAVGNVATLAFMCALLWADLERFYPVLPALAFLKLFSALFSLGLGLRLGLPVFLAIFALDFVTTLALVGFARATRPVPLWVEVVLVDAPKVQAGLERVRAAGLPTPTLEQLAHGVLRMWHRVLFRSKTVGLSHSPVRKTWRARLLRFRALRFPFLVKERAIAPLDFSGLISGPERIARHLLAAHHDGAQLLYDLELLRALYPGWAEKVAAAAREVEASDAPRSRWLKDLCVYEGYHAELAEAADGGIKGSQDPDLSFVAHLQRCVAIHLRAPRATMR